MPTTSKGAWFSSSSWACPSLVSWPRGSLQTWAVLENAYTILYSRKVATDHPEARQAWSVKTTLRR